ncbi:MAG: hypothetical protein K2L86_13280 [Lachnospiraceae bacterium]|nr:hypothetical protein [Lachnospiraceae bacterium]
MIIFVETVYKEAQVQQAETGGDETGSTFGSYHTLRMMQDTAKTSGVTPTVSDGEKYVLTYK